MQVVMRAARQGMMPGVPGAGAGCLRLASGFLAAARLAPGCTTEVGCARREVSLRAGAGAAVRP